VMQVPVTGRIIVANVVLVYTRGCHQHGAVRFEHGHVDAIESVGRVRELEIHGLTCRSAERQRGILSRDRRCNSHG
jgi:hypothetical protein